MIYNNRIMKKRLRNVLAPTIRSRDTIQMMILTKLVVITHINKHHDHNDDNNDNNNDNNNYNSNTDNTNNNNGNTAVI